MEKSSKPIWETAVLEVTRLNAAYGHVQVLWDVSLKVDQGEIVSVLGPNGAGKSTLLQTIMGMLHPITGTITYRGYRIDMQTPEELVRTGIALITEDKHLFLEMTVLDNLLMGSYTARATAKRAAQTASPTRQHGQDARALP